MSDHPCVHNTFVWCWNGCIYYRQKNFHCLIAPLISFSYLNGVLNSDGDIHPQMGFKYRRYTKKQWKLLANKSPYLGTTQDRVTVKRSHELARGLRWLLWVSCTHIDIDDFDDCVQMSMPNFLCPVQCDGMPLLVLWRVIHFNLFSQAMVS